MLLQTTAQKIAFSVLALFLLITAGKDWFDFYSCGAVSQCLSDAGTLQLYTKSVMTTMLTILAFITASKAFSGRDGKLLRAAFVFSLLADYSFSLLKATVADAGTLSTILGITFFMVFQSILIYRHSRKSEDDKSVPKIYALLAVAVLAGIALIATGTLGLTVAVVVVYGVFVITSVVVGILAPRKGYFPAANAKLIRWGMVAFFFGDVCVGLSMVTGDDHSALQSVAEIANNIIWWLYVPAQLMLIRACVKPKA